MALLHHFVVVVEDGKFWLESEVSINYDSGPVWDTEKETWEEAYNHQQEYEKAQRLLWNKLNKEEE